MTPRRSADPEAPLSLAASLRRSAEILASLIEELAGEGPLRDVRSVDSPVIDLGNPFAWKSLKPAERRLQSRLYREYHRFYRLVCATVHGGGQLHDVARALGEAHNTVEGFIQRERSKSSTGPEAARDAVDALSEQLEILDGVHGDHEETILVPDTNALYWNPKLEAWRVPSGDRFLIAITPTVIQELDHHKDGNRRTTSRSAKAAQLIRQIGEYRQRGNLSDGVPLASTSKIFSVATSAAPTEFFEWLAGGRPDDYFFASAMAVMRLNPRAPTAIVTRDVNLQNKIDFARLSFWSPDVVVPEASRGDRPKKGDE